MITEKQVNTIRGKMSVGKASIEEIEEFLKYVAEIEKLVEQASNEDFYGTQGWQYIVFGE
jgi:hypothetical protein